MARELAPAGLRSGPKSAIHFSMHTAAPGFAAAAPPSGSKLPRHGGPGRPTGRLWGVGSTSIVGASLAFVSDWVSQPDRKGNAPSSEIQANLPAFILWRLRAGDFRVCRVFLPRSANLRATATHLFRSEKGAFLLLKEVIS